MRKVILAKNNGIVIYSHNEQAHLNKGNVENLTRGEKNGELSNKARKKIIQLITVWLTGLDEIRRSYVSDKEYSKMEKYEGDIMPVFITLTLSAKQKHSDLEIKRDMLGYFITLLKRKKKVICYYWYAEKQDNGNLHFHLIIDRNVSWLWVLTEWNKIQDRYGYITDFRKNNPEYKNELLNNMPNSTDTKGLYNNNGIAAYISKYVSKEVKKGSKTNENESNGLEVSEKKKVCVLGRLWGCFDMLRDLTYFNTLAKDYEAVIDDFYETNDLLFSVRESYFNFYGYNNFDFLLHVNYDLHREITQYCALEVLNIYDKVNKDIIVEIDKQYTKEGIKERKEVYKSKFKERKNKKK